LWGVWILLSSTATLEACPICFQVDDGAAATGVRAAVIVLGGVTGIVLVAFAAFARRLARAEAANEHD